jgi:hypothetical protein
MRTAAIKAQDTLVGGALALSLSSSIAFFSFVDTFSYYQQVMTQNSTFLSFDILIIVLGITYRLPKLEGGDSFRLLVVGYLLGYTFQVLSVVALIFALTTILGNSVHYGDKPCL